MLLDTSAWIEFFQGTERGKKVSEILQHEENFTSIITLAELVNWCFRNNQKYNIKLFIEGIKKGSTIVDINETIAISAGRLNYERKISVGSWGMADSLIFTTAAVYGLTVLTKDNQFRGLPHVEMI